jgi:pilus assembly protein CpaC
VRMKIKPTADSDNRINTTIHAEVSQVVGAGVNGIPIIGAKTADTTLQANDGQTIVIGGLLENNINRDILRKLPWLADIPVIGLLFRDKAFQQEKREVLFFMTPEVIKDIDADAASAAKTPGMGHWVATWNKGNLVPRPNKTDDWGLHHPDSMGFSSGHHDKSAQPPAKPASKMKSSTAKPAPKMKSSTTKPVAAPAAKPVKAEKPVVVSPPVAAPAAEKPPVAKPAPPASTEEPTTNFSPARPAGE